ncbi:hypothetical protein ABPG72_009342 [Tetrahymena utriculariae]
MFCFIKLQKIINSGSLSKLQNIYFKQINLILNSLFKKQIKQIFNSYLLIQLQYLIIDILFENNQKIKSNSKIGFLNSYSFGLDLAKIQNITILSLDLHSNNLSDDYISIFAVGLANMINLQTLMLFIWQNNIGSQGMSEVGSTLEKLNNLSQLILIISQDYVEIKK